MKIRLRRNWLSIVMKDTSSLRLCVQLGIGTCKLKILVTETMKDYRIGVKGKWGGVGVVWMWGGCGV